MRRDEFRQRHCSAIEQGFSVELSGSFSKAIGKGKRGLCMEWRILAPQCAIVGEESVFHAMCKAVVVG